jgi:urocanate reductase
MAFRKKLLSVVVLCASVPAFAVTGTFEGEAMGKNDVIRVAVTLTNDHIDSVKVLESYETPSISRNVYRELPKLIVDNQTVNVDALSGATFSSFGFVSAVKDALKKSGTDMKAFTSGPKVGVAYDIDPNPTADIVIIGGGGAGLSAAVTAARAGASVLILEKASFVGGNTMAAGGGLNAAIPKDEASHNMEPGQVKLVEAQLKQKPKNELHAQLIEQLRKDWEAYRASGAKHADGTAPLFDSPAWHALQTWAAGDYVADLALVDKLSRIAPETVRELTSMGLVWNKETSQYVGALWPRSHDAANFKSGQGFIDTFLATIEKEKLPVKVSYLSRAEKIIMKDGRAVGVEATGPKGIKITAHANRGVIIASGGFSANVKMRMKYDTKWGNLDEKIPTTNLPGITGDGIVMAENVGANLVGMQYIQLLPICDPETGSTQTTVSIGTPLFVNAEGKRFINEMERRDVLAKAVLQQPGKKFWKIINRKNARIDDKGLNSYGLRVDTLIKQGKVVRADTIEELADKMGVPRKNLVETVAKWNEFCKKQVDPDFGRASCLDNVTLFTGPYYADAHSPAVHHTMGGIQIDTNTHVINKSGQIIPGLYAAGEVTGGIHGTNRIGANAIPDALSFGRVAAQTALKDSEK